MLESLHISNYALIDNIDIRFYQGLNIITGETGAGKSIMLGALSMLLGGRADSKAIRHTERKSVIEGIFNVEKNTALKDYCFANDIEWDDDRCILRRELSPTGRSRAFINDSPVTLTQLQGVGLRLIDIHSQHQNQLLADADFQRQIIDSIAGNGTRLKEYALLYTRFREALRKLKATKAAIAKDSDNADFMQYQLDQLDQLNLKEGELQQLEHERDVMANMTEIKSNLNEAVSAMSEGSRNVLSLLARVQDACAELDDILDEEDDIPARLDNAIVELSDIADTLSSLDANLNADPADLENLEERISDINSLMRKHNADSETRLIEIREQLRKRLERLDDGDDTLAELEKDARRAHRLAAEMAKKISDARKSAAETFAAELMATATPLGMKNLRCEIAVTPADMSPTGIDSVEFRFAFNKNQQPIPVGGAASGGEISRLMLSIKTIIADKMQLPSIIFDEVDTGVSGDVAHRMGQMMLNISSSLQVIAITHLPQVAAKGRHHFKVFKEDDEHATHTRINELTAPQRIDELALMLAGDPTNPEARATATNLLNQSH